MREALALKDHRSESQIYVERAATGAVVVLVLFSLLILRVGYLQPFNIQIRWRVRKKTGCKLSPARLFAV